MKGLTPSLHRKMKVVPQLSFLDACTRAIDIEIESKTSKGRRHGSESESFEESRDESNNPGIEKIYDEDDEKSGNKLGRMERREGVMLDGL